jgi:FkbM family methyltransferase
MADIEIAEPQFSSSRLRAAIKRTLQAVHLHEASKDFRCWVYGRDNLEIDYISALGWFRGRQAYRRLVVSENNSTDHTVQIKIPGLARALRLRADAVDRMVFEQVFLDEQYGAHLNFEPSLIIDGGAHIGLASVFLARKFPKAVIYAIEPDEANFELLCRNVAQFPRVIPIKAALWGAPSVLTISNPDSASWAFRVTDQTNSAGPAVIGITLEELLAWSGARSIDILKLDVEGAELNIFSTARANWLARTRAIFIELHDRLVKGCSDAFERAVAPYLFDRSVSGECLILREFDAHEASETG